MRLRALRIAAVTITLALLGSAARAQTNGTKPAETFYYIPHTHWEGAVFKTREEYLDMGLPNIMKALYLLKKYPNFKFTLDQVAYFKPFLERYPEEAAFFRKCVADGRLEIVGGMDVMPDDVKPGGELFVRQMQYGKQYCREQLGVDVTVAWFLDTFGHHPQMPQLLTEAGYKSFWFCRGVPRDEVPSEFKWKGIDGTEMPTFYLPGFYGFLYGPPQEPKAFARFFEDRYKALQIHVNGPERVGLAGVDVSEPEGYVPPLVKQYNENPNRPFDLRYSVPSEFAAVVAKRTNTPVLTGDFNPIFQGTYSSRAELKQTTRELEQRLLTAEKLGALSNWLGAPVDATMEWRAWEPMLFNQTHDLASGVMTDHVYLDVQRGYDIARRLSDQMINSRWDSISARIDTRGAGVPVVVFNTLGWTRTDVAEVQVGFAEDGVKDVQVLDSEGKPVASQVLATDHYENGGIKQTTIRFVAHDLPALGYAIYRVVPKQTERAASDLVSDDKTGNTIENEFYRVTVNRKTGEITSIFDKAAGWEALSAPANVVARQDDHGDLWELYHGLNGTSYIAMTDKQPVPTHATAHLSSDESGADGAIHSGPVFTEFSVSHPLGTGTYATRIRLYNNIRRIDIDTDLVNNEKYVRYQVLFPSSVKNGHNVQEIPFGSVERPIGIEYPAQQWVDYSDNSHGLALLNAGMPGNLVSSDTLMLSLMRSHSIGGYGFGGGFEPGMTSDTGFELNHPLSFHYALIPHTGDWKQAQVYRDGLAFNHPLLVRKATTHAGDLPGRWGMVEISQPNVILTTFKPGPGTSTILRIYEASGKATTGVTIKLHAHVAGAHETNLLEGPGRKMAVTDDTLRFDLHPFEIKTISLQLATDRKGH